MILYNYRTAYTTINISNPLDKEVILTYFQTDCHFVIVGLVNGTVSFEFLKMFVIILYTSLYFLPNQVLMCQ